MATQANNKNEVEPHAARGGRDLHYKIVATLAVAALTTLGFAQNEARDAARLPGHPSTPGNMTHPHAGTQPYQQPIVGRGVMGLPSLPGPTGGTRIEHQLSSGRRILETTQTMPGRGTFHAWRYGYGTAVTGVVEHPMKSGYLSRTYVEGGRVRYARVYRRNTYQRYGRAYSYERLVPAIAFATGYYAWAARPWATPVSYRWQWERERWHTVYGSNFTPYQNYTSLDEWLTDYVIAQNLRSAYESWQVENAPQSRPVAKQPLAAGANSSPGPYDSDQRPYWEEPDDGRRPYWEEDSSEKSAPVQPEGMKKRDPASGSRTGSLIRPPAEDAAPPLTGDMKAELNAQIKRQLVERQTPVTASNTEDLPDSLKPGHTLFRVNAPLDVPSKASGQNCSLRANDYIERTGDMDKNGMVPVKVRASGVSDCAIGLHTSVSVNDLEAMENEQQQQLTDALLAASKNMGDGRGLPQAPDAKPVLLATGQTRPAADATSTLSQLQ